MSAAMRSRQRGQSMLEYTLICAVLAFALLAPIRDAVSPDQPRTALGILINGLKTAYDKFSYSLSLPE